MRNLKSWIGNLTGIADTAKALKTASGTVDGSAATHPLAGQVPTVDPGATTFSWATPAVGSKALIFSIDGGGALPPTGLIGYVQVPFSGTITGWAIWTKDGLTIDATFDVWKVADGLTLPNFGNSITASLPPTITALSHKSSNVLTGWTTAVTVGDWIAVNLDSVSGLAGGVSLELKITAS